MIVKLLVPDGSLERVYHNLMLYGQRFLTKGRGKEEETMCQLHLIICYFIQLRVQRIPAE